MRDAYHDGTKLVCDTVCDSCGCNMAEVTEPLGGYRWYPIEHQPPGFDLCPDCWDARDELVVDAVTGELARVASWML